MYGLNVGLFLPSRIAGELTEELKREGVTFIPFYSPDYLRAKKI